MGLVSFLQLVNAFLAPFPLWFQNWFGILLSIMIVLAVLKVVQFILDLKFW